jgi:hypothetical protein
VPLELDAVVVPDGAVLVVAVETGAAVAAVVAAVDVVAVLVVAAIAVDIAAVDVGLVVLTGPVAVEVAAELVVDVAGACELVDAAPVSVPDVSLASPLVSPGTGAISSPKKLTTSFHNAGLMLLVRSCEFAGELPHQLDCTSTTPSSSE